MSGNKKGEKVDVSRRHFVEGAAAGLVGGAAAIYGATQLAAPGPPQAVTEAATEASYIVEIVAGTIYARPAPNSGLSAYSGADAATVIQNAVNALPTSGGLVHLRASTYTINSTIRLKGNMILQGEGMSVAEVGDHHATLLQAGHDIDILYLATSGAEVGSVVLRDFAIMGVGAGATKDGIHFEGSASYPITCSRLFNVYVSNCYDGIFFHYAKHSMLIFVGALNNVHDGIYLGSDSFNSSLYNCGFASNGNHALEIGNCNVVTLEGCQIETSGANGVFAYCSAGTSAALVIINSFIQNNTKEQLRIKSATANPYGSPVVLGCRITRQSSYSGISLEKVQGAAVIGNFLDHADGSSGKDIAVDSDCVSNFIGSNTTTGSPSNFITNSGIKTRLRDNPQYVTEAHGTSSQNGDGSTKDFNIAHGLAATPTSYLVLKGAPSLPAIEYLTADATNIGVHFSFAPANATRNVVLVWEGEV